MPATCSVCGQVNSEAARACAACGQPLASVCGEPSWPPIGAAGVFVGRQRELAALDARLDQAMAYRGSVALLAGEAGAGKSRTAQRFAAAAQARGAAVLWGACYEGEWAPPYGPWAEALGATAPLLELDRMRRQLGPGAAPLAQLVPGLRPALAEPPPALSPDEDRHRLYDAVSQFLLAAARERPIVLVLDDLHWADRDSLGLLRYAARCAARARLLVVGTYRDPDGALDRHHPLLDLLAALRREADVERIPIHGLSAAEVAAYLAEAAGQELPHALADAVYAETGGNPFYVRELLRHLVEERSIVLRDGRWVADAAGGELGVPEGVRQIVGRRLARLAEGTNTVLRCAAALTGGFEFGVMQALSGLSEDALLNCLDEALRAGVIRVAGTKPPTYDFVHAIVRHTLYDDLNPDRRARLHRCVAEALERVHAGHALAAAAELAAQYHASASLPGMEKGIPYALAAAEQARAGSAHGRAVTFLRMARDLVNEAPPATRADVLCRLALAEAEVLLLEEAQQTVEAAVATLSEAGAAPAAVAQFLANVARALKDGGAAQSVWEPLVERGLALVGDRRDHTWARLMLLRDRFETIATGLINASRWLGYDLDAVAIARASSDRDDYAQTLEPFDWRRPDETAAVLALGRTWQRPAAVFRALNVVARDLLFYHGAFREAEARGKELLAAATRYGSISGQVEALAQLATVRLTLGELLLARQTLQRAQELAARLGAVHRLHVILGAAVPTCLAYYLEGDWASLAETAARLAGGPAAGRRALHGLVLGSLAALNYSLAGDAPGARRVLAALTPVLARMSPTVHQHNVAVHAAASAVWELGDREFAAGYRRMALSLIAAGIGDSVMGASTLTVARMAALLGDSSEAGTYFARGRPLLEQNEQRPLRAMVDYDEALALLRAGADDSTRIAALLDAALTGFRALGMEAWARRAFGRREALGARGHGGSAGPAPVRPAIPGGLTAREVEVLRLVASGQSNKAIAQALVVSVPTVERHVANIYAKIGARGRVEATTFALRHGLAPAPAP